MASTIERAVAPSRPTRRTLLATVAILPTAWLAAGESDRRPAADPHPGWLAEWEAVRRYINGPAAGTVRRLDDLPEWERLCEREELIGDTPAAPLAGATAQLRLGCRLLEPRRDLGDEGEAALANAL